MCIACGFNPLAYNTGAASSDTAGGSGYYEMPNYGGGGANTSTSQGATSNVNTNGVLSGVKWSGSTLTYSFPSLTTQYEAGYGNEITNGFSAAPEATKNAIRFAMNLVSQYTNLATTEISATTTADIRVAFSAEANPTAYAYYPSNSTKGGDVWFGTSYSDYQNPTKGQYGWATAIHELGHALGLKHGHETGGPANTAMQSAYDQMAYSIMTYRSYQGGPTTGYTNETNGYAQTFMMYDIAALQAMYGANFNTNSGNTTYRWDPNTGEMSINGAGQGAPGGNRVFMTIWDGNGVDTYDFSNYSTNLSINLAPGSFSITSSTQLAYLGNGNNAPGNIFNALQYNGDARSLIENANGGSGNDTFRGNAANNVFNGNGGTDTVVFTGARASYTLMNYNGYLYALTTGADGKDAMVNIENLQFSDQTVSNPTAPTFDAYSYLASHTDLLAAFGGNTSSAWDHYMNYGFNEGRALDTFNERQYIASYNDLISAFGTNWAAGTQHYVTNGRNEGRTTNGFDAYEYLATYADVLGSMGYNPDGAASHFVQYGFGEGRVRDGFDNLRYTASHNDLISAFGLNQSSAAQHYVNYGYGEGRSKLAFDAVQYIASYADLISAFGTNTAAATAHFIQYGFTEGRSRDNFNATQYLANYADLRAAFGTDENAATLHYIQYGRNEGRTDHI